MTDRALKVYHGEDMSPVYDLTDELVWEEAEFVSKAANGESGLSTLRFRDESVQLSMNFRGSSGKVINPKNVMAFIHGSNTLWRGRAADGSFVKGARDEARYRELHLQATDYNEDLRGIIVDGWVRPPESDVDRVNGLIASYLSGNGRPTTVINGSNFVSSSNTVALLGKTYSQTDPLGVLAEITAEADKQFFIFPVATSTTDGELFYDGLDSVAYPCPFRFTDRPAEVKANPTTTFALWRDDTRTVPGQQFLSGVRAYYGSGTTQYVEQTSPTDEAFFAKWEESVNTDVDNATEAALIANAVRGRRSVRQEPLSFSAGPFNDAQIGSIRAGQLVDVKSTVFGTGDVYVQRRIVELVVKSNEPGSWFITMMLDSPRHSWGKGLPIGPKPPGGSCTDLTSTLAPSAFDGESSLTGPWTQGGVDVNPHQDGTQHSGTGYYHFHSLANPWATYNFSGTWVEGTTYTVGFWSRLQAQAVPATITLGFGTSTRTFGSDKVTLDIETTETDWTYHELEWTPTDTYVCDGTQGNSNVKFDLECQADDVDGIDFDDGSVMACSEATPPPASDDDTGDVGDDSTFSPSDHKHPAQTAANTPFTPAGTVAATNVQDAIEEISTEALTNPMTTAGDLIRGGASGLPTRLAIGGSNTRLGSDGAVPLWVPKLDLAAGTNVTLSRAIASNVETVTINSSGGGSGLTVEEADGAPSVSATTLVFPNGTLTDNGSGEVEYTPAGGGGGLDIQYPPLKPATPTDDFDGATLDAAWSAHSGAGSWTTSHLITQGARWPGSTLEMLFDGQNGRLYRTHANTDIDISVGEMDYTGMQQVAPWMFGIAALNSSGTGIGVVVNTDNNAYLANIVTWTYSSLIATFSNYGHTRIKNVPIWLRLTRVSGTWNGYVSLNGRVWTVGSSTSAAAITVDRVAIGTFYNSTTQFWGRLMCDWFDM